MAAVSNVLVEDRFSEVQIHAMMFGSSEMSGWMLNLLSGANCLKNLALPIELDSQQMTRFSLFSSKSIM
jgi:hypothetical protein